jgi:hypothetical protein
MYTELHNLYLAHALCAVLRAAWVLSRILPDTLCTPFDLWKVCTRSADVCIHAKTRASCTNQEWKAVLQAAMHIVLNSYFEILRTSLAWWASLHFNGSFQIHTAQRTDSKNCPRSDIHSGTFWYKINNRIEINIALYVEPLLWGNARRIRQEIVGNLIL